MQRVVLVGVETDGDVNFEYGMEELKGLAEACEMETVAVVTQKLPQTHPAFYVGTGKIEEIRQAAEMAEADCIVFDNSLKPSQQRNLQKALDLPVMDRTNLILEIFEKRARTKEARLQVESANLQYMLPRLVGMREALSRQGGGAGAGGGSGAGGGLANRGAGEQKLELDRRRIEKRLSELRRELEEIEQNRETQRKRRRKSELPSVALVGYTNAGKSTLLNKMLDSYPNRSTDRYAGKSGEKYSNQYSVRLSENREEQRVDVLEMREDSRQFASSGEQQNTGNTHADHKKVMEADMLFATLDTTVRRISPGDNLDFLLSDTVGFINRLPHTLIKAFRSTLAEACGADLILQVVDYSDPHYHEQMQVTADTLRELEAERIPCLYIMNKADRVMPESELPKIIGDKIYMSAKEGIGLEELLGLIRGKLFSDYVDCRMLIPYTDGAVVAYLKDHAVVHALDYEADGTLVTLLCSRSDLGRYEKYVV